VPLVLVQLVESYGDSYDGLTADLLMLEELDSKRKQIAEKIDKSTRCFSKRRHDEMTQCLMEEWAPVFMPGR
jgi:hypothetical protein